MKRKPLFFTALSMAAIVLTSCGNNDTAQADSAAEAQMTSFYVDTLESNLKNPWGMAWLPDGRLLVTERSGEILVFKDDKLSGEKLAGVPEVYSQGQGGLLDIKLHPKYSENGWIYITYSKPGKGGGSTTLMRAKLQDNQLVNQEELYQTTPIVDSKVHFGSRIVFDKDNYVYFSSGERGTKENAQTLTNDHGKIHRLNDDGSIPKDNPFVNTPNARPSIWSYGHRNPQGLIYDAKNDLIWETEHGPKGGDELNIVEKGKNYGWPVITYGIDYNDSLISDISEKEGMEQPVHYWKPSIGTCGLAIVTSDKYPGWKDNLMAGGLAKQYVARVETADKKFVNEEKLLEKLGRIRQIGQSPDGYIYVITEGPGLLVKLMPGTKK